MHCEEMEYQYTERSTEKETQACLNNLDQVFLTEAFPINPDCPCIERSLSLIRLFQE